MFLDAVVAVIDVAFVFVVVVVIMAAAAGGAAGAAATIASGAILVLVLCVLLYFICANSVATFSFQVFADKVRFLLQWRFVVPFHIKHFILFCCTAFVRWMHRIKKKKQEMSTRKT